MSKPSPAEIAEQIRRQHVTREIDDALSAIIANDERQLPIIYEDQFRNEVLPLLTRPWAEDNLTRYKRFVVELSNPLRVVNATGEKAEVLFVVPALYPRPTTTSSADATSVSVSHVVDHIAQQRERTLENLEPYITEFLSSISITTPVQRSVLTPLAIILARYGRAFEDDNGVPLYSLDGVNVDRKVSTTAPGEQASFGDSYED